MISWLDNLKKQLFRFREGSQLNIWMSDGSIYILDLSKVRRIAIQPKDDKEEVVYGA